MSSGAHDHAGHGHAGHGHAGHGQQAAADAHHGSAEIPPAPPVRSITPAPEDFENLPGPSALVWPFVWVGLAVVLMVGLLADGWHVVHADHGDGHAAPAPHEGAPGATHAPPHGG